MLTWNKNARQSICLFQKIDSAKLHPLFSCPSRKKKFYKANFCKTTDRSSDWIRYISLDKNCKIFIYALKNYNTHSIMGYFLRNPFFYMQNNSMNRARAKTLSVCKWFIIFLIRQMELWKEEMNNKKWKIKMGWDTVKILGTDSQLQKGLAVSSC